MFNWKGFENREFCVDFKNDADKMEFLRECEERGYIGMWSKAKPTEMMDYGKIDVENTAKKTLAQGSSKPIVTYNPHPIDCSIAENYISERLRIRKCDTNTGNDVYRMETLGLVQRAIEIVQAWSDEHPIEPVVTYLDKLLEVFPNAPLNGKNMPNGICPSALGLKDRECRTSECHECWSQPYKGE